MSEPLSREQVEEIARRAELCAEATIPGAQLRALIALALMARREPTETETVCSDCNGSGWVERGW